jgi:ASC-1-like (ASCH) protein
MAIIKKKTWPDYFELIKSGKKRIDLRVNNFDVKEGDILVLEEWNPETKEYTGRKIEKEIDYVLKFDLDSFNQKEEIKEKGLIIMQFKNK